MARWSLMGLGMFIVLGWVEATSSVQAGGCHYRTAAPATTPLALARDVGQEDRPSLFPTELAGVLRLRESRLYFPPISPCEGKDCQRAPAPLAPPVTVPSLTWHAPTALLPAESIDAARDAGARHPAPTSIGVGSRRLAGILRPPRSAATML